MKPQHTISRRGFITAFLGTAVAASLAACAPAQTGTPTAPSAKPTEAPTVAAKPTAAPTTAAQPTGGAAKPASKMLKLYHDKSPWNDNYNKVGSFIAQRIGVGFEGVPYPDTTTYQTAVRQALPSRTAPDLFTWWSGYRMKDLVDQGLLADLTSVWQKRIQAGELAASIADPFTFDGKVYAVSNNAAYWVLFYNKAVFEKMKLTEPQTWDDLMKIADTLKQGGVTPFAFAGGARWPSFTWFEEILIRTDPELYVGIVEQKINYSDQRVVAALQPWKEMLQKGYFPSDLTQQSDPIVKDFAAGKYGMALYGDWFTSNLKGAGMTPGKDVDVFVVPNINPSAGKVIIIEAGPLCVPKNAPDIEAAMQVVDFWLGPEAQSEWAKLQGWAPINSKATVPDEAIPTKLKQLGVVGGSYRYLNRFWEATPVPIVEYAVDKLNEFMLNPDRLQSVLEDIDRFRERQ